MAEKIPHNPIPTTPMPSSFAHSLEGMKNKYIEARQIELEESEGKLDKEEYEILTSSFANTILYKGNVYHLSGIHGNTFYFTNAHFNKEKRVEIGEIKVSSISHKYEYSVKEIVEYSEYKKAQKETEKEINGVKAKLNTAVDEIKETTATDLILLTEEEKLTATLKNINGDVISESEVSLPTGVSIETIKYDEETNELIFIFTDGSETRVSLESLVNLLVSKEEFYKFIEEVNYAFDNIDERFDGQEEEVESIRNEMLYYEKLVSSEEELREALSYSGKVVLAEDIDLSTEVIVPRGATVSLDLNEHTLYNTTDIWSNSDAVWSLISVQGGSLTIIGSGTLKGKANDCYAVDVRNGGTLIIKEGEYVGNLCSIYSEKGFVEIYGGTFSIQQLSTTTDPYKYLLNCYDSSFKEGTALFTTYGGTYINFDPSVATGPKDDEGNPTHEVIVPERYKVVSEEVGEDIHYSVVLE